MVNNEKKFMTTLVLIEDGREIEVEKSQSEILKDINDESVYLKITDINGLYYLIPKMVIKFITSTGRWQISNIRIDIT